MHPLLAAAARPCPQLAAIPMALLVLSTGLTGCKGADADPIATPPPTWHEDIRPIVEETCMSCHTEDGGMTGIPLTTYEDYQAWAWPIANAVAAGTMPPWRAESDCNSYKNDFSLSPESVDTLVRWVNADTPEGDASKAAPTRIAWVPPTLARVDAELIMKEAFTPTKAPDDYRCFIMDWDETETTWMTGYNFKPGNTDVVHHVIPFIIPPDEADVYRALDDAEDGDGYPCFGGPGGNIDSLIEARWLGAWAPGGGATVMPEGYGLLIEPGSIMVMQVHYHVDANNTEFDQSSVEIQLEHTPLKTVQIQPWTEVSWVLGMGMEIPANTNDVSHTWSYTFESGAFRIHDATLHMHTMGQTASMVIRHADGSETCVIRHDEYDFNWQRSYQLEQPVEVTVGDTMELTCTWDNPTDQIVQWGDGTGDEMCLGVTMITWE
ncbi:MAG: monooxygenase [Rhodobacterales bacterium]|nr:monooxygenase [Rhodobacterales bacterium]